MLIDSSYFTEGPRHILNASMGTLPNPNAMEVNKAIMSFIESYQTEFLCLMLGDELGCEADSYILSDREGEVIDHVEGLEEVCLQLKESFADYVFFQILAHGNTQATDTGLVRLKCANQYVAPINRQVLIWNVMVERNRRFVKWAESDECKLLGPIHVSSCMLKKLNPLNI